MQKNIVKPHKPINPNLLNNPMAPKMIEVIVNDRLGKKEKINRPKSKKTSLKNVIQEFKQEVSGGGRQNSKSIGGEGGE